jgi:hypothetical protein
MGMGMTVPTCDRWTEVHTQARDGGIPKGVHLGKLVAGVDMQQRERDRSRVNASGPAAALPRNLADRVGTTGLSNSAAASRRIYMLSASSCFKWLISYPFNGPSRDPANP